MKQILTVFKFTYLDAFKKKAFIITTVVLIALVFIVCLIPSMIEIFSDDPSTVLPETGEETMPPDTSEIPSEDQEEFEYSQTCYYFDSSSLFIEGFDALSMYLFDTNVN